MDATEKKLQTSHVPETTLFGLEVYIRAASDDLATAVAEYPSLEVCLRLAREALRFGLAKATEESDRPLAQLGHLRSAMDLCVTILDDAMSRRPDLKETSSLICDVAFDLRAVYQFPVRA